MSHRPTFANHLKSLGRTIFRDNRINKICPENPCQQLCFSVCRFFPTELSPSYFPRFPVHPPSHRSRLAPSQRSSPQAISHNFPSVHPLVASMSLVPLGALPKLFPTISLPSNRSLLPYRSFPPDLSPSYFTRFPFRPPCRHSRIAPFPTGALPKLFPTVSLPSTLSSLPYRSFALELSPSYFPRLPFRPPCHHSRIAPSHRTSPQAISHSAPSIHPVVIPISLLPTGTLPKLFPFRPPCRHFLSVHPVVIPVSLLPTEALPKLFPTISLPSTLSSFPYLSFPPELSPSYFPRFSFRPP